MIEDPFSITFDQRNTAIDKYYKLNEKRQKKMLSETEEKEQNVLGRIFGVGSCRYWYEKDGEPPFWGDQDQNQHWIELSLQSIKSLQNLGFTNNDDIQYFLDTGKICAMRH